MLQIAELGYVPFKCYADEHSSQQSRHHLRHATITKTAVPEFVQGDMLAFKFQSITSIVG
jgi:hypothetical protein